MKRSWIFGAAMALLCSCTENAKLADETIDDTLAGGGIPITATITMSQQSEDEPETKVSSDYGTDVWNFTWEAEDATGNVYAYYKTTGEEYGCVELTCDGLTDGTATAEFTGSLPDDVASYRIFYKSDDVLFEGASDPTTITVGNASIDLNSDALSDDLDNLFMISDLITVEDGATSLTAATTLNHVGAFIALNIDLSGMPTYWYDVTIDKVVCGGEAEGELAFKYRTWSTSYWDEEFSMEASSYNALTITPSEAITANSQEVTLYFNILPTTFTSGDLDITVYFSNGTNVTVTKSIPSGTTFDFERAEFSTINIDCFPEESADTEAATTYTFATDSGSDKNVSVTTDVTTLYIYTEAHLASLAAMANAGELTAGNYTFELMNDIEITSDWWAPIGYSSSNYFAGTFNGNGNSIKGYKTVIEDDDTDLGTTFISLGLFGYISGESTVVKNLIIESGEVELGAAFAAKHVGILAGTLTDATIMNCGCDINSTATQLTRGAVGGLVGLSDDGVICNSYNQGTVKGTTTIIDSGSANVGGLCGSTYDHNEMGATIDNCYNSGTVSVDNSNGGSYNIGAIVGGRSSYDHYTNIYYLTGCAGDGILGANNSNTTSEYGGITSKSEEEMQELASTLNTNMSSIVNLYSWIDVDGGYPTLDFNISSSLN